MPELGTGSPFGGIKQNLPVGNGPVINVDSDTSQTTEIIQLYYITRENNVETHEHLICKFKRDGTDGGGDSMIGYVHTEREQDVRAHPIVVRWENTLIKPDGQGQWTFDASAADKVVIKAEAQREGNRYALNPTWPSVHSWFSALFIPIRSTAVSQSHQEHIKHLRLTFPIPSSLETTQVEIDLNSLPDNLKDNECKKWDQETSTYLPGVVSLPVDNMAIQKVRVELARRLAPPFDAKLSFNLLEDRYKHVEMAVLTKEEHLLCRYTDERKSGNGQGSVIIGYRMSGAQNTLKMMEWIANDKSIKKWKDAIELVAGQDLFIPLEVVDATGPSAISKFRAAFVKGGKEWQFEIDVSAELNAPSLVSDGTCKPVQLLSSLGSLSFGALRQNLNIIVGPTISTTDSVDSGIMQLHHITRQNNVETHPHLICKFNIPGGEMIGYVHTQDHPHPISAAWKNKLTKGQNGRWHGPWGGDSSATDKVVIQAQRDGNPTWPTGQASSALFIPIRWHCSYMEGCIHTFEVHFAGGAQVEIDLNSFPKNHLEDKQCKIWDQDNSKYLSGVVTLPVDNMAIQKVRVDLEMRLVPPFEQELSFNELNVQYKYVEMALFTQKRHLLCRYKEQWQESNNGNPGSVKIGYRMSGAQSTMKIMEWIAKDGSIRKWEAADSTINFVAGKDLFVLIDPLEGASAITKFRAVFLEGGKEWKAEIDVSADSAELEALSLVSDCSCAPVTVQEITASPTTSSPSSRSTTNKIPPSISPAIQIDLLMTGKKRERSQMNQINGAEGSYSWKPNDHSVCRFGDVIGYRISGPDLEIRTMRWKQNNVIIQRTIGRYQTNPIELTEYDDDLYLFIPIDGEVDNFMALVSNGDTNEQVNIKDPELNQLRGSTDDYQCFGLMPVKKRTIGGGGSFEDSNGFYLGDHLYLYLTAVVIFLAIVVFFLWKCVCKKQQTQSQNRESSADNNGRKVWYPDPNSEQIVSNGNNLDSRNEEQKRDDSDGPSDQGSDNDESERSQIKTIILKTIR